MRHPRSTPLYAEQVRILRKAAGIMIDEYRNVMAEFAGTGEPHLEAKAGTAPQDQRPFDE